MSKVLENLSKLKQEIAPYTPKIIAVTKYYDESKLIEAYKAGLRDFGENRVQDAIEKFSKLPDEVRQNSTFHLIGHLQTNKVKKAVGEFDYIHSVDSLKLAELISETAGTKGIIQKIFLQINNAGEEQKSGMSPDDLFKDFENIINLKNLKVVGLMTIAPLIDDEKELRKLFQEIIQIKDKIQTEFGYNLIETSMGMSNDFRIAIEEGSTIIRIGRKLFN